MKTRQVAIPSREGVITAQLNNLLGAANLLLGFLDRAEFENEDGSFKAANEIDGGVKMGVEVTALSVMNRIDQIIKDDENWGSKQQRELHDAALRLYAQNEELLRISTMATRMAMSPHVRTQPKLIRHPEGGWLAVLGDLTKEEESLIVGHGVSPEAAMQDFDEKFVSADPRILAQIKGQVEQRMSDLKEGKPAPTPALIEPEEPKETKPKNPRKKI